MSVSPVVTMGLGSWGTPSLLITLGYGIGAAPAASGVGIEARIVGQKLQLRVRSGKLEGVADPNHKLHGAARSYS
jgi:hypothetical protein